MRGDGVDLEQQRADFEKFMERQVAQMRLEHEAFMREMRKRFFYGIAAVAVLYLGAQAFVYLLIGRVTWP